MSRRLLNGGSEVYGRHGPLRYEPAKVGHERRAYHQGKDEEKWRPWVCVTRGARLQSPRSRDERLPCEIFRELGHLEC